MADPVLVFKMIAKDKTSRAFRAMRGGLRRVRKSVFSLKTGILGLLGAGGIGALISKMTDLGDAAAKTARKLGLPTAVLQELQFAAGQAGIKVTTFDMALQRMTRRAAEAANNTGEANVAFKALGIELRDVNGNMRRSDDILKDVADAMTKLEDPADRVRVAMKLFDSEGVSMVNMLSEGSAGLKELTDQAELLGVGLSEHASNNMEDFSNSMGRAWAVTKAMSMNLIAALAPSFTAISDWFTNKLVNSVKASGGTVAAWAGGVATKILDLFQITVTATDKFHTTITEKSKAFADLLGLPTHLVPNASDTALGKWLDDVSSKIDKLKVDTASYGTAAEGSRDVASGFNEAAAAIENATWKSSEFGEKWLKAEKAARDAAKATRDSLEKTEAIGTRIKDEVWGGLTEGAQSFAREGKLSIKSFAVETLRVISDMLISKAFQDLRNFLNGGTPGGAQTGGGGGIGAAVSSMLSFLPGFANGGDVRVGGAGATDSQVFMAKVSPNETIKIRKPGQGGEGGSVTVVNHVEVTVQGDGADSDRKAGEQTAQVIIATIDRRIQEATRPGGILNPSGFGMAAR